MTVTGSYTTTGFTFAGMSAEEIRDICLGRGSGGDRRGAALVGESDGC